MTTKKGWIDLNIKKLVPADWNYKTEDKVLSEKLKNNIKRNGQIENIIVRLLDTGFYEVTNGNHRLTVFKELGINNIKCYNLGKVSLQQAQRIAIETNETKFQTNEGKLSGIINELLQSNTIDDLLATMPYSQDEFDDMIKLNGYDWTNTEIPVDDYGIDEGQDKKQKDKKDEEQGDKSKTESKPREKDLFDNSKTKKLLNIIKKTDVTGEVKEFLNNAVQKHIKLNNNLIAKYYSFAPQKIKDLMRELDLVN